MECDPRPFQTMYIYIEILSFFLMWVSSPVYHSIEIDSEDCIEVFCSCLGYLVWHVRTPMIMCSFMAKVQSHTFFLSSFWFFFIRFFLHSPALLDCLILHPSLLILDCLLILGCQCTNLWVKQIDFEFEFEFVLVHFLPVLLVISVYLSFLFSLLFLLLILPFLLVISVYLSFLFSLLFLLIILPVLLVIVLLILPVLLVISVYLSFLFSLLFLFTYPSCSPCYFCYLSFLFSLLFLLLILPVLLVISVT